LPKEKHANILIPGQKNGNRKKGTDKSKIFYWKLDRNFYKKKALQILDAEMVMAKFPQTENDLHPSKK
jgi:hypothetical protein